MEKLIGKKRYIGAVNDNIYFNVNLKRTASLYKEENLVRDISEYDIFLEERASCTKYLPYGKMEFLFDDYLNFKKSDWVMEIGYPTYVFYSSSEINYFQDDVGLIIVRPEIQIQIDEVIIFTKNEKTIYTKVLATDFKEDGQYVTLDTLKDLKDYKMYHKEIAYDKVFNLIETIKYFDNGFSVNIFGNQVYQYATVDDIDISKYKGFLDMPLNELCYRIKYIGEDYQTQEKYNNNIISRNVFSIDELSDISVVNNFNYIFANIKENANQNINESGRERVTSYVRDSSVRTSDSKTRRTRTQEVLPKRPEGEGLEPRPNKLSFFMYNYFPFTLKEYGEVIEGNIYSDIDIPYYAMQFPDMTYKYKSIMEFEDSETLKEVPFMNDKNYIFEDLKFTVSRTQPVAKYQPLYYVDEIDEDSVSSLVNPLEKRLC